MVTTWIEIVALSFACSIGIVGLLVLSGHLLSEDSLSSRVQWLRRMRWLPKPHVSREQAVIIARSALAANGYEQSDDAGPDICDLVRLYRVYHARGFRIRPIYADIDAANGEVLYVTPPWK